MSKTAEKKTMSSKLKTEKKVTAETKPNPFPPMKLGTGRHLAYISDTLFDDDLYD